MARPTKINIETFPFDVDFFDNKIMVRIAGEYGVKGEIIAIKLLCAVYRNGYFMKWSIDERALMIRYLPGISLELLDQVLNRLLKWNFFDEGLFMSARILTSVDIQKTYFNAIRRRTGINRNSFPYLLIDPEHPNNASAYKNGVSAYNNGVSAYNNGVNVNNNSKNDAETQVYVISKADSGNNNGINNGSEKGINAAEKEFLHTETGVSAYINPINVNNNSDLGNKNHDIGNKNPLEKHFAAEKEFLHTETGVSAYINPDNGVQKPKTPKNNNDGNVDINPINVNNNSVSAYNNGEKDNDNSNSDSNNPDNIIYSIISSNNNNKSNSSNQEVLQNFDFGKQKGKECLQELESDLKDFLNDEIWIDGFCKNHDIQKTQLPELIEKFKIECISSGKIAHIDYQDTKKHFNNWLRIYLNQSQNLSKNYGSTEVRQKSKNRRRGTPANSETEKNYYGSF